MTDNGGWTGEGRDILKAVAFVGNIVGLVVGASVFIEFGLTPIFAVARALELDLMVAGLGYEPSLLLGSGLAVATGFTISFVTALAMYSSARGELSPLKLVARLSISAVLLVVLGLSYNGMSAGVSVVQRFGMNFELLNPTVFWGSTAWVAAISALLGLWFGLIYELMWRTTRRG